MLLLAAMTAHADEPAPEKATAATRELPTESWLELQRSGQAASPQAQPLSGPAMERVHQRYLKSFEHPLPPYFVHDQPLSNSK
jgi:hypothetical protein